MLFYIRRYMKSPSYSLYFDIQTLYGIYHDNFSKLCVVAVSELDFMYRYINKFGYKSF